VLEEVVVLGVREGCVTVAGGCFTVVAGGWVTVVVGCFTFTLIEFVVDCFAAVEEVWVVLAVLLSSPLLTARAMPTPAAATASTPMSNGHVLRRRPSGVPHCGHACASRATGAPQLGQKPEDGGSRAGGCADIGSSR
jgi:hypothetical protein